MVLVVYKKPITHAPITCYTCVTPDHTILLKTEITCNSGLDLIMPHDQ